MRSDSTQRIIVYLAFILVGGMLSACGGENGSSGATGWEVRSNALTLQEDLRIGEGDFFFGSINDLTVRADGQAYVADGKVAHVKVLSPDGTLQDSIGQSGDGPGEFNQPIDVYLGPKDSLYVLDAGFAGHMSVFAPGHAFTYRKSVRAEGDPLPRRPIEVLSVSEAGYVMAYSSPPLPNRGPQDYTVQKVSLAGAAGDTLLTYPPAQQLVERDGGSVSIIQIPFARRPAVKADEEGNIHYAWSDSLGVRVYGSGGELRRTVDLPYEPVPITEEDRERALEDYSEEARAAVLEEIPETKPAFKQFLVDDQGRYWFGRPTTDPDSTDWWVADPDDKRIMTTTLPSTVEIEAVRDGSVYGQTTTDAGAPVLVRYRIE
jgi:hypothetical protein